MYRFEKGDEATGLIFNNAGADTALDKWMDERKTLNFAFNSLSGATIASLILGITALAF